LQTLMITKMLQNDYKKEVTMATERIEKGS